MYEENENLLLSIPEHAREWEISGETNLVIIKKPKFQGKFLRKYLLPRLSRPDFRIRLDEFGSFVWKNIDGRASVMEIGDRLRDEFGGTIEPVYERLGLFVQTLYNTKCIIYREKTDPPDN